VPSPSLTLILSNQIAYSVINRMQQLRGIFRINQINCYIFLLFVM